MDEARALPEAGVLLTLPYDEDAINSTALLDLHPTTGFNPNTGVQSRGNLGRVMDAMLYVGEEFEIPGQGLTVRVVSASEHGVQVEILESSTD
jgi:hypothetical protein